MTDVIREDVGGQVTAFQLFWRENKGTELVLPSTTGCTRLSLLKAERKAQEVIINRHTTLMLY